jgi:hypothetical protein
MQGSLKLIEKMRKTLARLERVCPGMERGEIDPLQPHMIGACRGTHGRLSGPIRYLTSNLRWFEDWTAIGRVL